MSDVPPDTFRVGDVITMRGPSVPREWWERQFRVTAVNERGLPTLRLLPMDETSAQTQARALEALRRANV
jgi:hypothetical protein